MTEGTIGDFWTKVDPRHLGILLGCSHGGTLFPHNFPTSLPLRTLYHISMYCFKCYFCLLADRGYFPDAFFTSFFQILTAHCNIKIVVTRRRMYPCPKPTASFEKIDTIEVNKGSKLCNQMDIWRENSR